TTSPLPEFLSQPASQTILAGQTAFFSASISSNTPTTYQWYHECRLIAGATNTTLTLSNVQPSDVGQYTIQVQNAATQVVVSVPAFLEIGPTAHALSYDKLADLFANLALGPQRLSVPASVSAGIPGTQIINNFGCITDQGETNLCLIVGGASRWFEFKPSQS